MSTRTIAIAAVVVMPSGRCPHVVMIRRRGRRRRRPRLGLALAHGHKWGTSTWLVSHPSTVTDVQRRSVSAGSPIAAEMSRHGAPTLRCGRAHAAARSRNASGVPPPTPALDAG